MINIHCLFSCRFSPERHRAGAGHVLGAGAGVQRERQLRPLQNHLGNVQLRQQGHLLLRPRGGALAVQSTETRAGQTAPAHLRDSFPNEQRSAAEICSISDHGASHRGAADGAEARGWNSVPELGDQPGPRWVERLPAAGSDFQAEFKKQMLYSCVTPARSLCSSRALDCNLNLKSPHCRLWSS